MPSDPKETPPLISPPIPTYEEATSSHPIDERQGLLGVARRSGYHQEPSLVSARSSEDTLDGIHRRSQEEEDSDADSDDHEGLRREVEQMDIADLDELEEGRRARGKGWVGRLLGFKRRLGRNWRWSWRPEWTDGWGYSYSRLSVPSLPSIPERYQPGVPVIARLLGLFIIIGLGYALFVFELLPQARNGLGAMYFDQESVRQFAQGHVNGSRIEEYLRHVTSFDHMAGTEGSVYLAKWMQGIFYDAGLDTVRLDQYDVYLNYPKKDGRRVAIVEPIEQAWEAKLEEEQFYPPSEGKENTPVFHGLSKAGDVRGPLVYCNYGSRADYKRMYDSGIDIKGAIALVRYYGEEGGDRALKVKAAEEWGVKGVLIYSDPKDDGFVKGKPWPEGRWRPDDSVQRGSVGLTTFVAGDVLTPGYASVKGAPRVSKENNPGLVKIPSLPLAWRDAQHLLQALKGHGEKLPDEWHGGVPDVEWWSGDKNSPIVNLKNEQDEVEQQPIYNLVGAIEGMETAQKKIIVGNHRDSWCFGSGDPGSGTAVLLEVVNIFKHLRMQGWRPLRTIEFISWDAEEYNIIGSTEHVEDHIAELRKDGMAYLNVDVGVVGPDFWADASPLYKEALYRVLGRVTDPIRNETLLSLWHGKKSKIGGLGAGSDYLPFQDIAGTSSIDFGFGGGSQDTAYPYHSCYETFEWMMKFGDPGLEYHKLLAQVWALLIIELSGEFILRFDLNEYAANVAKHLEDLQTYSEKKGAPWQDENGKGGFILEPLWDSAKLLVDKAANFHRWENWWDQEFFGRGGLETNSLALQRILHNNKMAEFETNMLDIPENEDDAAQDTGGSGVGGFFTALIHGGLGSASTKGGYHTQHHGKVNKTDSAGQQGGGGVEGGDGHIDASSVVPGDQFKHVIFGPERWQGYKTSYFPKIRDAIDAQDWPRAQEQVERAARIIRRAAERLTEL